MECFVPIVVGVFGYQYCIFQAHLSSNNVVGYILSVASFHTSGEIHAVIILCVSPLWLLPDNTSILTYGPHSACWLPIVTNGLYGHEQKQSPTEQGLLIYFEI